MSLMKWDPFRELEAVSNRLNRLFASPLSRAEGNSEAMTMADWAPAVDVSETPESYLVKAELPGVKKEDVKVTLNGGLLSIRGERKQEKEEKGERFHRVERSYGSFMRSFQLPETADPSKVDAEFKDGVLTITLAKTERAAPQAQDVTIR